MPQSKIFAPTRSLGFISNHIPLQVRYIKNRKENLIVTCVGKSFHTYGISHFSLLSVSGLHPDEITCMSADTFHVYTSCNDQIYAWRRGTELKHVYKGKNNFRILLPLGVHLISVDDSNLLQVWDIKNESVFLELLFSAETFNISCILHPSTYINKILLGSDQGELQLWNINKSKLVYTFKGWGSPITCLEQSSTLDVVAVGLDNGNIILHNLKYDKTVMTFTQDFGSVISISFRLDGLPIMVTGSVTGNLVFWDLERRCVASQLKAHNGAVTGMKCLPSEPLMLTSSPDNSLKLWIFDMPDGGARLLRIREGHSKPPTFIRYYNNDNVLSSGGDSTLRIFNTQNEQFNKSLGRASYDRTASRKRRLLEEDPLIMQPIQRFSGEPTHGWPGIVALHANTAQVTTWSYDRLKMGDLRLLPERLFKKNNKETNGSTATTLCVTRCGNFALIGYSSGHVDRFNIQSGIHRDSYGNPTAHSGPIRGVEVDSLNKVVVTGGGDLVIKFWHFKCKGGAFFNKLPVDEPISFFRTATDGSLLAVALEDGSILVVDIEWGRCVRRLSGHRGPVNDAAWSADGRLLFTAGADGAIRSWDVVSSCLVDQFRLPEPCISLDCSLNGAAIITAHVGHLGIFLWTNKLLFNNITLKAINIDEEPELIKLPECCQDYSDENNLKSLEEEESDFISKEQLDSRLITYSGLPSSRWANLIDLHIIKKRNKPKAPPKVPKAAPFFIPTLPSLSLTFDLSSEQNTKENRFIDQADFNPLTDFGKLVVENGSKGDFISVIKRLKLMGPSILDMELKSLSTNESLLRFMQCLEFMFESNRDFELASSYLGVFLRAHGPTIANVENLKENLTLLRTLHASNWQRLQQKLQYCMCVLK